MSKTSREVILTYPIQYYGDRIHIVEMLRTGMTKSRIVEEGPKMELGSAFVGSNSEGERKKCNGFETCQVLNNKRYIMESY